MLAKIAVPFVAPSFSQYRIGRYKMCQKPNALSEISSKRYNFERLNENKNYEDLLEISTSES
jgi:hypothetical protein